MHYSNQSSVIISSMCLPIHIHNVYVHIFICLCHCLFGAFKIAYQQPSPFNNLLHFLFPVPVRGCQDPLPTPKPLQQPSFPIPSTCLGLVGHLTNPKPLQQPKFPFPSACLVRQKPLTKPKAPSSAFISPS